HLSTDTSRDGVKRAQSLARSFPSYERLRDSLLRRLSAPGCGISGAFKGKDAALAILAPTHPGGGTAGSLVLVDTGKDHPGSREHTCGLVSARYVGRYLAIGQPQTLGDAVALAAGKGRSLATDPLYRQASKGLPDDRVIDAFASAAGVRDLLAPQTGLLGAVGALLDRPGLRGVAASLSADDPGAKIVLRTITTGKGGGGFRPFHPALQSAIPKSAFAYLGVSDVGGAAKRLLGALSAGSGGGGTAGALAGLLQRAKAQLDREAGGRLTRDVLSLFKGEVAVALTPAVPAPVLTIVAHTRSDAATSAALGALRAPLARLLTAPGASAPTWRAQTIAGTQAYLLRLAPGIQIAYAVFGGKLVIATQPSGIAAVRRASAGGIGATDEYKQVVGAPGGRVTSVLFLDFHQLLRLGEETGLGASAAYQSFKGDLEKVRAVGAHSSGAGDESTAEILLSIP
ncbi:MAG TPA: DUF3352 domain-containing protein, partial [Solirubrobacteraceae bacterium]|nr:DUF3352 domain-containing protein [Solirubrobacteraceae bacterium]